MKILAVCPRIPAAKKNGDQVLSYHRLAFLAKKNAVQVLCFGHNNNDDSDKIALEALGIIVHTVPWRLMDALWFGLMALFDRSVPFQCGFYTSFAFRRVFRKILRESNPDAVYAVTVRPLLNIGSSEKPLFVDMVDSMGLNFSRRRDATRGLKKVLLAVEAERVLAYERKVAQHATRSFVVSDLDRAYIGENKVSVLPLGIDLSRFQWSHTFNQEPIVVFSGNMFYQPNIEAALWFVNCCWQAVKALVPEARLVIAGGNPVPSILALSADSSITVTGRVESMAAVLNASQVAVAPMQSGSGMQFKVLEAMVCAVPVVATTIGLGDIKAIANQDILIGDTPEAIVDLVVGLLKDVSKRVKVGEAGYRYVLANHQWNVINERFSRACGLDGLPQVTADQLHKIGAASGPGSKNELFAITS
jgi:glycosyltransferase involved in cell wall biosynthesis